MNSQRFGQIHRSVTIGRQVVQFTTTSIPGGGAEVAAGWPINVVIKVPHEDDAPSEITRLYAATVAEDLALMHGLFMSAAATLADPDPDSNQILAAREDLRNAVRNVARKQPWLLDLLPAQARLAVEGLL